MKRCATCGVEKAKSEFFKKSDAADGCAPHCKECKREIDRAYRVENRERLLAFDKERYQRPERKEAQQLAAKGRYGSNKQRMLENMKKYAAENRDKCNANVTR